MSTEQVPLSVRELADAIDAVDKKLAKVHEQFAEIDADREAVAEVTLKLKVTRKKEGYVIITSHATSKLPEATVPRTQIVCAREDGFFIDRAYDKHVGNQRVIPGTETGGNVRPIAAAGGARKE